MIVLPAIFHIPTNYLWIHFILSFTVKWTTNKYETKTGFDLMQHNLCVQKNKPYHDEK